VINQQGHIILTPEARAEKLRAAAIRHGKAFAVEIPMERLKPAPAANVYPMHRQPGGKP